MGGSWGHRMDIIGHVTYLLNSGNASALLAGGFGVRLGIAVAGASGIWACRSKNTQV